jgi:ABC-2 type transport system ATP-binding protein
MNPSNGLDPQGMRDLRDLLRARAAAGGTVFVSSHLLGEVEHLADEVVVVNHGRLGTTGTLSDLQETRISVRTPSAGRLANILQQAGGTIRTITDRELLIRGLTIEQIGDQALRSRHRAARARPKGRFAAGPIQPTDRRH